MKWIEQIRLRTLASQEEAFASQVSAMMEEVRKTIGILSAKLYLHASLETDLLIHIRWDTETEEPCASPVAAALAFALRRFGIIDHSVWVERD